MLSLFQQVHITGVLWADARFSDDKCEICSDKVIKNEKKREKKYKHMLSEAFHIDSCAVIKTLNVLLYISQ